MFIRGAETRFTAVYLDGVRLDSQSTGGAVWESIPLSLIERIESIAVQLRKELFAGVSEEEQRLCQDIHARILGNLEKG